MRRLSIAAAIVVLGALVFTASAQACSCARLAPAEAMGQADAAIAASLIEVVPRDGYRADYRYRVQRVFKGGQGIRPGKTIAVSSSRESAACGLPSEIGRSYGLLLVRGEGRWRGGLCGVIEPRLLDSVPRGAAGRTSRVVDNCAS